METQLFDGECPYCGCKWTTVELVDKCPRRDCHEVRELADSMAFTLGVDRNPETHRYIMEKLMEAFTKGYRIDSKEGLTDDGSGKATVA